MINRPQLMKHQATLKSDGASDKLKSKTVTQEDSQILSFQPNFKPDHENNPALKQPKPVEKNSSKSKRHLNAYIQSVSNERPKQPKQAKTQKTRSEIKKQTESKSSPQNHKHSQF